jgi:thiamine pyrophosphate-dependent acetolactate synthase large subunit-like protein
LSNGLYDAKCDANIPEHSGDFYAYSRPMQTTAALQQAADIINKGSKVAMLIGRGCLNGREEVLELAEFAAAPVATGGIGLLGTAPSQDALQECDTFLMAGTAFPSS